MLHKVVKALMDKQDEMARLSFARPMSDYASYMQNVGVYQGLQMALSLIDKVVKEDITK